MTLLVKKFFVESKLLVIFIHGSVAKSCQLEKPSL